MKINRIIFALIGTAVLLRFQTACTDNKAPVKTLATVTNVINGRCPEMVDRETRLDSVILSQENNLEYYYTLIYREKRQTNEIALKGFLVPGITENIRENSDLRMHRDSSVTMLFIYRDRNGEPVTEISIGPDQYR